MPAANAVVVPAPMVPTDLTRIVDTREAVGLDGALSNNDVKDIQITGEVDTVAGAAKAKKTVVPEDADAVVLNVTAVNASEAGYFVAWEKGTSRPPTSNINFQAGDIVANGATVPLSADGKISIFSRGGADLLLDIAGYYSEDTYTSLAPERVFDSSLTPAGNVGARSITRVKASDGAGDLVTLNLTVDNPEADGYLTAWPAKETMINADNPPTITGMPQTSNLNFAKGQIVANTVQVLTGTSGYVNIYTMTGTRLIVDVVDRVDSLQVATYANMFDPAKRIMDTRSAIGSSKTTGYRDFSLIGLDPTNANTVGAAIVNVTVTNPKAAGFASIGPNLESMGATTSVLNFKEGQTIANRVVIPANFAGKLQAYTNVEADIILDVVGYTKASSVAPKAAKVDLSKLEGTAAFTSTLTGVNGKTTLKLEDAKLPAGFKLLNKDMELKAKYTASNSKKVELSGTTGDPTVKLPGLAPDTYTAIMELVPSTGTSKVKTTLEVTFTITDPTTSSPAAQINTGTVVANTRLDYEASGTPGVNKTFVVSDGTNNYTVTLDEEYADAAAKLAAINADLTGITASYDGSDFLSFDVDAGGNASVVDSDGADSEVKDGGVAAADPAVGDIAANTRLDYAAPGTPNAAKSFTVTVGGNSDTVNLDETYADAAAKLAGINSDLTTSGATASYDGSGHLVFSADDTITVAGADLADEFGADNPAAGTGVVPLSLLGAQPTDVTVKYEAADKVSIKAGQPIEVTLPSPFKNASGTAVVMVGEETVAGATYTTGAADVHELELPSRTALMAANTDDTTSVPSMVKVTLANDNSDVDKDPDGIPGNGDEVTSDGFRQEADGDPKTGRSVTIMVNLG